MVTYYGGGVTTSDQNKLNVIHHNRAPGPGDHLLILDQHPQPLLLDSTLPHGITSM